MLRCVQNIRGGYSWIGRCRTGRLERCTDQGDVIPCNGRSGLSGVSGTNSNLMGSRGIFMRTPLTLDEDIAGRLQAESLRTGRSFTEVVNEHRRTSLARSRGRESMGQFRVPPKDLGGLDRPGLSSFSGERSDIALDDAPLFEYRTQQCP